jgi:hypothetical protein
MERPLGSDSTALAKRSDSCGTSWGHHGPPALELVRCLMETEVVKNCNGNVGRQPSTLGALERRWFVGRQSLPKAKKIHATVEHEDLSKPMLGKKLVLIGTCALLELAQLGNRLVTVNQAPDARGWHVFTLSVPVGRAGRHVHPSQVRKNHKKLKAGGTCNTVIPWKTNGAAMGTKQYYVHDDVVDASRRHILHIGKGCTGTDLFFDKPNNTALAPVSSPAPVSWEDVESSFGAGALATASDQHVRAPWMTAMSFDPWEKTPSSYDDSCYDDFDIDVCDGDRVVDVPEAAIAELLS